MTSRAAIPRPKRRTQAERTQVTQQKLVKSTIALLKHKRYAGFRVAEAADAAGVSRGAQSHHFPVKDDLVLHALEAVYSETQMKARARIDKARADPTQLFQLLIEDSEDFFLGEDFFLSLDLMMIGGDQPLGVEVKKLALRYRVPVEQAWLDAFVEAGYSPREAGDVVLLTFAIARGLGVRKLMSGETAHFPRLLSLWESLADGLLATAKSAQEPSRPRGKRAASISPSAQKSRRKAA